eukprot:2808909-Prymnesium_polylepis.1
MWQSIGIGGITYKGCCEDRQGDGDGGCLSYHEGSSSYKARAPRTPARAERAHSPAPPVHSSNS